MRDTPWMREMSVAEQRYQAVSAGSRWPDGTSAKALTRVDDYSRMCVCARLMAAERTRAALAVY